MGIEELKQRFLVSEDQMRKQLETLVGHALEHCVVDRAGRVHLKNPRLSGRSRVKLILAARLLANQLDEKFSADVTVDEMGEMTGLPRNQVRARLAEVTDEKFAEASSRGAYRAVAYRVGDFLEQLGRGGAE